MNPDNATIFTFMGVMFVLCIYLVWRIIRDPK